MAGWRLDFLIAVLVILAGPLGTSATSDPTVLEQASGLWTPVQDILNHVHQKDGVDVVDLKMDMQSVSGKARSLLSILPQRVLSLMAELELILNVTDTFVTVPNTADEDLLTTSFVRLVTALNGTRAHLLELVPVELTRTTAVEVPARQKRSPRGRPHRCCWCCGNYRCGRKWCPCRHCPRG